MAERMFLPPEPEPAGAPNNTAMFLSLFLLVLAFFILLVTISTLEEVKSKSVMDSLTTTFTSIVPPSTDPTRFKSKDGDIITAQQFQETVTELFSTAIQVAQVKIVHPGRLMQVQMPARELFVEGEARLQARQFEFLDRLVAASSGRPPGLRFDLEFVIGSRLRDDGGLPQSQTLELARAGAFAREMFERGLPPDSVAIGIEPGDPDQVTLWFHIRREEETRLRLAVPDASVPDDEATEETAPSAPATTPTSEPTSAPTPAPAPGPIDLPSPPSLTLPEAVPLPPAPGPNRPAEDG